ncbi:hypothetical protein [Gemmata sp.]|uniref:hypothetical protein n=1 Tax=Gemmata sp. TaxID=1914242 RepID=UPI003F6F096B
MANPLVQECKWPGVVAVASLTYCCGHGISPARAILTTYPQTAPIGSTGDLVIGDGVNRVTLRDCRVSRLTGEGGPSGQTWTLEIEDRRWRWPGLGKISGSYNQLDNRGKLVPWTIRSPMELAKLCLDAMGETGWEVVLPDGLPRAAGADTDKFLKLGENFAQSTTNPPTSWDHTPPAEALARLADQYGCRVVYQPNKDRVLVTPTGRGEPLPFGPCESLTAGVDSPRVPVSIGVAGAPVRIQTRFLLEAVGEEWDGSYRPIDDLSYAPRVPGQPQVSTVTFTGTTNPSVLGVDINPAPASLIGTTLSFAANTATHGSVAGKLAALAAQINTSPDLVKVLTAAASPTVLTLTATEGGLLFAVRAVAQGITAPAKFEAALVQPAGPANGRSWRYCPPPSFPSVRASDNGRLSYSQAQDLARRSVFRCYRVLMIDPFGGTVPYQLPWYKGKVLRRQQIHLEQTKVEQVVPAPRIPGAANKNNPANFNLPLPGLIGGVLPEFYNGYSRDQAAAVTGSVFKHLGGQVMWNVNGEWNTAQGDRVFAGFTIDPMEQIVVFSDYVYTLADGMGCLPAALTLETAVTVSDADTGELVRWEAVRQLGGPAPPEWQHHDDLRVGVVGQYTDDPDPRGHLRNALTGWEYASGDEDDATGRAKYYLDGMQARYQMPESDGRQYIGIKPIDPDGLVHQVEWSIGGSGPVTRASANSEINIAVPSYWTRRRAENLPPNAAAAIANQLERARAAIPDFKPPAPQPGAVRAATAGVPPG